MGIRIVLSILGTLVGLSIGAVLDIAMFCAITAVPLAALVYLSIITVGAAKLVLAIVAVIAVVRILFVWAAQNL